MKPETQAAYYSWRAAAEKGYGETQSPTVMARIDAKIRRKKAEYERLLVAEKSRLINCPACEDTGTCEICVKP